MTEIWKPITGYEGLYEVSNMGRVRSFVRKNFQGKILSPCLKCGYPSVILCKKGEGQKWALVHRLVAEAFIPNEDNLPIVNHKDETRDNNCVDNLEWCTTAYNLAYGSAPRRRQLARSKPCIGTWPDGTERWFEGPSHAERETGIFHGHICQVCNGIWKTAGKVKWRYAT